MSFGNLGPWQPRRTYSRKTSRLSGPTRSSRRPPAWTAGLWSPVRPSRPLPSPYTQQELTVSKWPLPSSHQTLPSEWYRLRGETETPMTVPGGWRVVFICLWYVLLTVRKHTPPITLGYFFWVERCCVDSMKPCSMRVSPASHQIAQIATTLEVPPSARAHRG